MERFELRLTTESIDAIDRWRSGQSDVPTRSEAARRLIELGLGTSSLQSFMIMKHLILTNSRNRDKDEPVSASAFAWHRNVYPLYDDAEWAEPFAVHFDVSKQMAEELHTYLFKAYESGRPLTYYDVERHFQEKKSGSQWTRPRLINCCRYMFLEGDALPEEVWKALLKDSDHPIEASQICRDLDARDIYV